VNCALDKNITEHKIFSSILSCPPETTLRETVAILRENKIGAIGISENKKPVGNFSRTVSLR
jgi:CBS domain-containing protein